MPADADYVLKNTKKRMTEVIDGAKASIHEEVETHGDEKKSVKTKGFVLTMRDVDKGYAEFAL